MHDLHMVLILGELQPAMLTAVVNAKPPLHGWRPECVGSCTTSCCGPGLLAELISLMVYISKLRALFAASCARATGNVHFEHWVLICWCQQKDDLLHFYNGCNKRRSLGVPTSLADRLWRNTLNWLPVTLKARIYPLTSRKDVGASGSVVSQHLRCGVRRERGYRPALYRATQR